MILNLLKIKKGLHLGSIAQIQIPILNAHPCLWNLPHQAHRFNPKPGGTLTIPEIAGTVVKEGGTPNFKMTLVFLNQQKIKKNPMSNLAFRSKQHFSFKMYAFHAGSIHMETPGSIKYCGSRAEAATIQATPPRLVQSAFKRTPNVFLTRAR